MANRKAKAKQVTKTATAEAIQKELSPEERQALAARRNVVEIDAKRVDFNEVMELDSLKHVLKDSEAARKRAKTDPSVIVAKDDNEKTTKEHMNAVVAARKFCEAYLAVNDIIEAVDVAKQNLSRPIVRLARYAQRIGQNPETHVKIFDTWVGEDHGGGEVLAQFKVADVGTYTDRMRSIPAGSTWLQYASDCRRALKLGVPLDTKVTGYQDFLYETIRDVRAAVKAYNKNKASAGRKAQAKDDAEKRKEELHSAAEKTKDWPENLQAQWSRMFNAIDQAINSKDGLSDSQAGHITVILAQGTARVSEVLDGSFDGEAYVASQNYYRDQVREMEKNLAELESAQHEQAQEEELKATK